MSILDNTVENDNGNLRLTKSSNDIIHSNSSDSGYEEER